DVPAAAQKLREHVTAADNMRRACRETPSTACVHLVFPAQHRHYAFRRSVPLVFLLVCVVEVDAPKPFADQRPLSVTDAADIETVDIDELTDRSFRVLVGFE